MAELQLRCQCGAVRGVASDVTADNGTRLVCMCDDCQTYAHYLGRAADVLDENGGTEVYQTAPAHITITAGHDQIRCVRQHPKGLMRWYAQCCNTPLINSLASPRSPFAGVLAAFYAAEPADVVERTIGPVRARTQGRWGYGELPQDASMRAPLGVMLHASAVLLRALASGKHAPTPLFTAQGAPIVEPTILSAARRAELKQIAVAWGQRRSAR